VLERELAAIGVNIVGRRAGAVGFEADRELAYKCCFWVRSAVRVRELLVRGRATSREELYEFASSVDWESMMTVSDTLAVDASIDDPRVPHSNLPPLVVKDAIVDALRKRTGRRPFVDRDDPVTPVFLSLRDGESALYRDLGGASLHKRGYRDIESKSPLNEAIAAGLLLRIGFNPEDHKVLLDPMCGSATFLIEAAWIATDTAPGSMRSFAFERFRDRDATAIARLRQEVQRRKKPTAFKALGADHHPGAIWIAKKSIAEAGVQHLVRVEESSIANWDPPEPGNLLVTNPPWGLRMEEGEGLESAWHDLGGFLRKHAVGIDSWVLSGAPGITRSLGLSASQKLPVKTGPVDCRFLQYRVHPACETSTSEPSVADAPQS
jgi:putative N6-adenine-specific DNA methylase